MDGNNYESDLSNEQLERRSRLCGIMSGVTAVAAVVSIPLVELSGLADRPGLLLLATLHTASQGANALNFGLIRADTKQELLSRQEQEEIGE